MKIFEHLLTSVRNVCYTAMEHTYTQYNTTAIEQEEKSIENKKNIEESSEIH